MAERVARLSVSVPILLERLCLPPDVKVRAAQVSFCDGCVELLIEHDTLVEVQAGESYPRVHAVVNRDDKGRETFARFF